MKRPSTDCQLSRHNLQSWFHVTVRVAVVIIAIIMTLTVLVGYVTLGGSVHRGKLSREWGLEIVQRPEMRNQIEGI